MMLLPNLFNTLVMSYERQQKDSDVKISSRKSTVIACVVVASRWTYMATELCGDPVWPWSYTVV